MVDKIIHKVTITPLPEQTVTTEAGADFISVQRQGNNIALWYIFQDQDYDLGEFQHVIYCISTGEKFNIDKFTRYLGTVIDSNQYVWHIFKGKTSSVSSVDEKLRVL